GSAVALLGFRDRRYRWQYWLNWFVTVYLVVLGLSAPFEFLPAGRYADKIGFQGILNQPQAYGVYVVPITLYLTVTLIVQRGGGWFFPAVVMWAWYSIYTSGCRTAFLAAG